MSRPPGPPMPPPRPLPNRGMFPTELDRLIAHDLEDIADRMLSEYAEQRTLQVITSRPIGLVVPKWLADEYAASIHKVAGIQTISRELLGFAPRHTRLEILHRRRRDASLKWKITLRRRRIRNHLNEARIRLARLIGGQRIIDDIVNNECRDYDW